MNQEKFGDSYDMVKRSLLGWLSSQGAWAVHPMFTDDDPAGYRDDYCHLLGVDSGRLVFPGTITGVNREDWLEPAEKCEHHLFIDPDTGVPLTARGKSKVLHQYLLYADLVDIAKADIRKDKLTLIYDQSVAYNQDKEQILKEKLVRLQRRQVHGLAYMSHASFLLVSKDKDLLKYAHNALLKNSGIPDNRFVWPIATGN